MSLNQVKLALDLQAVVQPEIRQPLGSVIKGPQIVVDLEAIDVEILLPRVQIDNKYYSLPTALICEIFESNFERMAVVVSELVCNSACSSKVTGSPLWTIKSNAHKRP